MWRRSVLALLVIAASACGDNDAADPAS